MIRCLSSVVVYVVEYTWYWNDLTFCILIKGTQHPMTLTFLWQYDKKCRFQPILNLLILQKLDVYLSLYKPEGPEFEYSKDFCFYE